MQELLMELMKEGYEIKFKPSYDKSYEIIIYEPSTSIKCSIKFNEEFISHINVREIMSHLLMELKRKMADAKKLYAKSDGIEGNITGPVSQEETLKLKLTEDEERAWRVLPPDWENLEDDISAPPEDLM